MKIAKMKLWIKSKVSSNKKMIPKYDCDKTAWQIRIIFSRDVICDGCHAKELCHLLAQQCWLKQHFIRHFMFSNQIESTELNSVYANLSSSFDLVVWRRQWRQFVHKLGNLRNDFGLCSLFISQEWIVMRKDERNRLEMTQIFHFTIQFLD